MPLTIQYCSDLHLEFALNATFMKKHPLQVTGDILVLAGDVVPFGEMERHKDLFDFVSDHFAATYWLPGNHEYYHADASMRSGVVNELVRNNVWLVNNTTVVQKGVELIFSTLWSHIDHVHSWQIARAMSDFHAIRYHGAPFTIADFNQLHSDSVAFINRAITAPAYPQVVVTHHIPTFLNYPAKYAGDVVSQAFATELGELIAASHIHSWIYGHHHTNTPDFMIGNTQLLTNQLGYVKHGEHTSFSRDKCVRVIT